MRTLLIFSVLLALAPVGIGYAAASPPDEEWNQTYGGSGIDHTEYFLQTPDGGYIAAGDTDSEKTSRDVWVMYTDPGGKLQWQESFGGPGYDAAKAVLQAPDGNYIVAGDRESCSNEGVDFWLIKLDRVSDEHGTGGTQSEDVHTQTPGTPGFGWGVTCGILFWYYCVLRKHP